jgi:hypothetical protein
MTEEEREQAIMEAASAFRERDPRTGAILPSPAWRDLDEAGRQALFEATFEMRLMEAALDPQGLSSTARVVLAALPRI